jgi:hypothetical protein
MSTIYRGLSTSFLLTPLQPLDAGWHGLLPAAKVPPEVQADKPEVPSDLRFLEFRGLLKHRH